MSYTKTVWEDRYIETPNTYTITENQDNTVTLEEVTGTVYTEGTPVNATNMNKLEQGVYDANDIQTLAISCEVTERQSIASQTATKITGFDKTLCSIGTHLTLSNNEIVIGTDINNVEVNVGAHLTGMSGSNYSYIAVFKNGTEVRRFANSITATQFTYTGVTQMPVEQGDTISMYVYYGGNAVQCIRENSYIIVKKLN